MQAKSVRGAKVDTSELLPLSFANQSDKLDVVTLVLVGFEVGKELSISLKAS